MYYYPEPVQYYPPPHSSFSRIQRRRDPNPFPSQVVRYVVRAGIPSNPVYPSSLVSSDFYFYCMFFVFFFLFGIFFIIFQSFRFQTSFWSGFNFSTTWNFSPFVSCKSCL